MIDELRDLYQEVILDHGRNPRNCGHRDDANRRAHGHNPMCGDSLVIYLKIDSDGIIEDASFEGRGCAISMASASMMTEVLKGKSESEAKRLFAEFHGMCTDDDFDPAHVEGDEEALDRLQVLSGVREFPVRVKCATLAWHTMQAAIEQEKQDVTTE